MLSTVEQRKDFNSLFPTHPIEVAWASEAIFFITVEEAKGKDPLLKARAQISVDGVNWINEGTSFKPIKKEGQYFIKLSHFGGWLRLLIDIDGVDSEFNLTIHLSLKE